MGAMILIGALVVAGGFAIFVMSKLKSKVKK